MAKSKMNKNKIFTSAKKIFKSRDELEQEEVLDIEQQDIAQEIEQLRAEIKAFYLEHPDKDPSMPDKIYVKDMNELEEKITEHIPKKVVEDEIVIKNMIEQDGPAGSNPLDFSRMKEYDLPDEYRSQVFSPDIVETDVMEEQDTVVERSDEKTNADTIRELFGEELYQEMGETAKDEAQNIIVEDKVNENTADLNSVKDSLDQDLLKQLQELRMEEGQDSELKNRVFTHQDSSKYKSTHSGEESGHIEQAEQEAFVGQMDDETQSMSDLLSRLLSEGKLEADLHSKDNQEDNGDVYIPGLNMESAENTEKAEDEDESIEITDTRSDGEHESLNTEEPGEVHDSNLSDLLSNLLSNDQISEADESPETDTDDTEEYRNKVFISSVKADKNMPRPESAEDGRVLGHGNEKAGNKPGDTVILQEYGENGEEQIEINLDGLPGEGPDNQDLSDDLERKSERPEPVSMDNSLKQEIVPGFGSEGQTNPITSGEDESSANHDMESAKTQSNAHVEDESEESNTSEEVITDGSENKDNVSENHSPENSREKQVQLDEYSDEIKIVSGENADEILKVEMERRKSESEDNEETDSDNLGINSSIGDETTDQFEVMEDLLNSLLGGSDSGIDQEAEAVEECMDMESSGLFHNDSEQKSDVEKINEMETASVIGTGEHAEQLKGKSSSNTNNIEDILNLLMEDTQAGQSDLQNNEKQNIEKQNIEKQNIEKENIKKLNIEKQDIESLEYIDEDKDSAEEKKKTEPTKPVSAEKRMEDGIAAYFQEDHAADMQKVIHKKISDPVSVAVPEKKKIVGKAAKEENNKKPAAKKVPEERITKEKLTKEKLTKEQKQTTAEIVKADSSSHAVKVLTEEKRQSLLSRLIQKIRELFKKKPKLEIVSQEAVMEESNVYKSQEKETFINGLITGSVSGDNVTLNPLAVVKKDVIAQGKVLCLSGAAIMGKVSCDSIVVEGTVFGEIEARGKVVIKNDALVLGNIYSSDVRITQGAMVQGDIFFKNPERKGK